MMIGLKIKPPSQKYELDVVENYRISICEPLFRKTQIEKKNNYLSYTQGCSADENFNDES